MDVQHDVLIYLLIFLIIISRLTENAKTGEMVFIEKVYTFEQDVSLYPTDTSIQTNSKY